MSHSDGSNGLSSDVFYTCSCIRSNDHTCCLPLLHTSVSSPSLPLPLNYLKWCSEWVNLLHLSYGCSMCAQHTFAVIASTVKCADSACISQAHCTSSRVYKNISVFLSLDHLFFSFFFLFYSSPVESTSLSTYTSACAHRCPLRMCIIGALHVSCVPFSLY